MWVRSGPCDGKSRTGPQSPQRKIDYADLPHVFTGGSILVLRLRGVQTDGQAKPQSDMPGRWKRMTDTAVGRLPPEHPNGIRRVQVGCGPSNIRSDWWNTDVRPFEGIDEVMDAAREWRWRSRLDYVYGEHFLEHLDLEDAIGFLTHAGHALAPGGRIRLSTPSLEWVLTTHFGFAGPDAPEHLSETLTINRAFYGWGHRFLYSRGLLHWLMQSVGYAEIAFFAYGQSDTEDLRGLEMHADDGTADGYPSVWIVEARCGDAPVGVAEETLAFLEQHFLQHVRGGH
jgi:hypothetical protein